MARGFDSKSVSEQQDESERSRERKTEAEPVSARRRTLELARVDLARRIDLAPEAHRKQLRAALVVLDEMITKA
jgi:hypothetical protein